MKKAVVATTAASGAAVSNRRRTAVQSVYILAVETLCHHPSWWERAKKLACAEMLSCNESFHTSQGGTARGVTR